MPFYSTYFSKPELFSTTKLVSLLISFSLILLVPPHQVEELRRDLRIKSQELEAKNAAANDKLKKMVKDQQEAEKKKVRRKEFNT